MRKKSRLVEEAISAVKERLFATESEVKILMADERNMRVWSESKEERFWGLDIDDGAFIFTNHCLDFLPNRTWGRVGVHKNGVMDRAATVVLLEKSHEAYMNFYQDKIEKGEDAARKT